MAGRGTARELAQSMTWYDPSGERDADEITDEELANRRTRAATRRHTGLLRPKSHTSHKSKYNTARGSRFEFWNMDTEVDVKAHIRDASMLKKAEKWDELIAKGITNLVIEDDDNTIKSIPNDIVKIQTLKSLTLLWNKIDSLPQFVFKMPLTELSVQKCPLKGINGIHHMSYLVKLEVTNAGLSTLPQEISQVTSLESLNLTGNKIKALPMNIGSLRRLKTLCVCGNKLATLPLSLTGLADLETLDVSQNQLRDLPDLIGNLTNLTTLRLTSNQLSKMPHSVRHLQNLRYLFLSSNEFFTVPAVLDRLQELHTLHFSSNSLSNFESDNGNPYVSILILDKNRFTNFPSAVFKCSNLEQLSLQHNNIPLIPPEISQLENLRMLKLGCNDLDDLPNEICQLKQLRHLVIRENNLEELPYNFDKLENLRVIDIEDTKLDFQFLYALKNNGVEGLLEQVRNRREQHKDEDAHSDRGSSVFDDEDESVSDSDDKAESDSKPLLATDTATQSLLRDSGYTDDSHTSNHQSRKEVKTIIPESWNTMDDEDHLTIAAQTLHATETGSLLQTEDIEMIEKSSQGSSVDSQLKSSGPLVKPKPSEKPSVSQKPSTKPKPSADVISRMSSSSSLSSEAEVEKQKSPKPGPPPTKPKPRVSKSSES